MNQHPERKQITAIKKRLIFRLSASQVSSLINYIAQPSICLTERERIFKLPTHPHATLRIRASERKRLDVKYTLERQLSRSKIWKSSHLLKRTDIHLFQAEITSRTTFSEDRWKNSRFRYSSRSRA